MKCSKDLYIDCCASLHALLSILVEQNFAMGKTEDFVETVGVLLSVPINPPAPYLTGNLGGSNFSYR